MKYTPKKFFDYNLTSGAVTSAKVGKKIITTNSGDPAASNDTGEGYIVGSMWLNTTSGEQFVCTQITAEDAIWYGQLGEVINPPFVFQATTTVGRTGGFEDGTGTSPTYQHAHIQAMTVASEGNSTDIGEVSPSLGIKGWQAGCAKDGSHVYYMGGINTSPGNSPTDEMVRHGISSPATLADIGEVNNKHAFGGNACDGSKWLTWGGGGGATSIGPPFATQIESTTFASPATSSDSGGDLATDIAQLGAHTDLVNSRAYSTGGLTNPGETEIDTLFYFSLGISSGNETDYGEASFATHKMGSSNSTTHAYHWGSHSPFTTEIEKYPMTAPTSNTAVGEVSGGMFDTAGSSAPTDTYVFGGATYPPSQGVDTIQKFSFASDGDATNVGEMTEMAYGQGCWQD